MILNSPYITGSLTVTGNITASGGITISGSIASSSYATNAERLDNFDSTSFVFTSSYNTDSASVSTRVTKIEGNYATTGSNVFMGTQTVCANITSTGTIIAQTLNVQQVTSSIVYSSGSNIFGCSLANTQQFTGSVTMTGSLNVAGNTCVVSICSPAHVGGTFSGTTVYGSTAICGGVVCGTSATFSSTLTATGGVYVGSGIAGRNALSQSDFRIAAANDTNILNAIAANTSMTIKSDYYGGGSATPLILQSGANSNQLYLATTGNVGIGTNAPTSNYGFEKNLTIASTNNAELSLSQTGNSHFFSIGITNGFNFFQTTTGQGYVFYIGGTERMRITSDGFVGVGVTPSNWCSVGHGRAIEVGCQGLGIWGRNFKEVHLTNNYYYSAATTRTYVYCACASDYEQFDGSHTFYTAPWGSPGGAVSFNSRLQIFNSGIACFACQVCAPNLLISNCATIGTVGFSYPEFNLAVTPTMTVVGNGTGPVGEGIYFKRTSNLCQGGWISGNGGALILVGQNKHASAFGSIYISSNNGTCTCDIMVIDGPNQRVGIGTTTPCATLTVEGTNSAFPLTYNSGFGNIHIQTNETTATQNYGGTLTFGGLGRTSGPTEKFIWAAIAGRKESTVSGDGKGYLQFGTLSDDTNKICERMRITACGILKVQNMGVTYESSTAGVNEIGTCANDTNLVFRNVRGCLTGARAGVDVFYAYAQPNSADASFYEAADSTDGSTRTLRFKVASNGTVYSRCTSITIISSDCKLKTDIVDYDKGLSEVISMKPRYFKYKDDLSQTHSGFIAQEMNEALPGSMIQSYIDQDCNPVMTYQVDWYPLLVNAIKQQHCTICTQALRITLLESCLGLT